MAAKDAKKDAKKKGGKEGPKQGKGNKGEGATPAMSVRSHPRAGRAVRRSKGWGGLVGFGVGAYVSLGANLPAADAALRALGVGVAGYLVAWACSVAIWRVLLVAELRVVYEQLHAERADRAAQAEAAKAAKAAKAANQAGPGVPPPAAAAAAAMAARSEGG